MASKQIAGSQTDESDVAVAEPDEAEEKDTKAILKELIDVKVTDAGVLRKCLTIKVPQNQVKEELNKEYKELIAEAIVPGFRRGRAPRRLIEKRFGQEVGAQVQTRLISNAYLAAVEKVELKVLGDPLVWARPKARHGVESTEQLVDMPTALQTIHLPDEGDLEFRCEVEIRPEVKIPELDGISIEKPQISISDEDVTTHIDRLRAMRGSWTPVTDDTVKQDDLLVCDLKITADGKEVAHRENITVAARPQRLEGVSLEDLGKKLVGASTGDHRKFDVTLPDDYEIEEFRGKKAVFDLAIQDIKRLNLPPLDAEFLTTQGFDSEQELREWIRRSLESRLDQEIRGGLRNQVRKYLLEHAEMDLPEGLSNRQADRVVMRRVIEMQRRGVPDEEIAKHSDELKTTAKAQAIEELKLHFILEEIAEKLGVEVSEEEINSQIAEMARAYNRRFDRVRDELARTNRIEMLYLDLRDDKCIDTIVAKAKIVETEGPTKSSDKVKGEKPAAKQEASDAPAGAEKTKKAESTPKADEPAKSETQAKSAEKKPRKKQA